MNTNSAILVKVHTEATLLHGKYVTLIVCAKRGTAVRVH